MDQAAVRIALAAVVLTRISVVLGALAFLTGTLGLILAVVAVHTGKVEVVPLLTYPPVQKGDTDGLTARKRSSSVPERTTSKSYVEW